MKINEKSEILLSRSFMKYSKYKNGYLKKWIEAHYDQRETNKKNFDYKELYYLVFMIIFLFRIIKVLPIIDNNNKIVVYFGSPWHYLGGNRFHNELSFLLWTINFIALYLFLHNCQSEQYKWLEIFAFLSGLICHEKIGIN